MDIRRTLMNFGGGCALIVVAAWSNSDSNTAAAILISTSSCSPSTIAGSDTGLHGRSDRIYSGEAKLLDSSPGFMHSRWQMEESCQTHNEKGHELC